jgi:hypothetical protein
MLIENCVGYCSRGEFNLNCKLVIITVVVDSLVASGHINGPLLNDIFTPSASPYAGRSSTWLHVPP